MQVRTITPEENCYYPDADWLIGNHSDELTPWIPVFAARSSTKCNFFLLPCCAYEFNGQRFQRKNSKFSVYSDYVEYLKAICISLNFEVNIDKLRIPSTKRICIVGRRSQHDCKSNQELHNQNVHDFVICNSIKHGLTNFIPRAKTEQVRNCTKIEDSVILNINDVISKILIDRQMSVIQQKGNSYDVWSEDYSITLREAISYLNPDDLQKLKNECGGLQTLLRNNHFVYFIKGGRILFRKPVEKCKTIKWKNKLCWFFHNHPLSCPLEENKCSFIH